MMSIGYCLKMQHRISWLGKPATDIGSQRRSQSAPTVKLKHMGQREGLWRQDPWWVLVTGTELHYMKPSIPLIRLEVDFYLLSLVNVRWQTRSIGYWKYNKPTIKKYTWILNEYLPLLSSVHTTGLIWTKTIISNSSFQTDHFQWILIPHDLHWADTVF